MWSYWSATVSSRTAITSPRYSREPPCQEPPQRVGHRSTRFAPRRYSFLLSRSPHARPDFRCCEPTLPLSVTTRYSCKACVETQRGIHNPQTGPPDPFQQIFIKHGGGLLINDAVSQLNLHCKALYLSMAERAMEAAAGIVNSHWSAPGETGWIYGGRYRPSSHNTTDREAAAACCGVFESDGDCHF